MAGAFLLPALSPEDGIPVVQAGSCCAALHCDEFSTDVFLLSLLSTLPVLLFPPACLQPQCSRFLNMSGVFILLLLLPILLLNLWALVFDSFYPCMLYLWVCVCVCVSLCCSLCPNSQCGCCQNYLLNFFTLKLPSSYQTLYHLLYSVCCFMLFTSSLDLSCDVAQLPLLMHAPIFKAAT